jgi:tyrosinase
MPKKPYQSWHVSRREFLTSAAAAVGSAAIPYSRATAQGAAKWRRINLSDPNTPQAQKDKVLASYKKAIRAMLARGPEDPLNWYRNALIHTVDCPHGNWWFLPWHRGYIGWFEKKCRLLSEDQDFALPYWDWTIQQKIPPEMFEDVLDPRNPEFIAAGGIANHDEFKTKFKDAVRKLDYWDLKPDGTPTGRYGQLLAREIRFPDDLWFDIIENPPIPTPTSYTRCFFDQAGARGLKKEETFDEGTIRTVFLPTILDALAPRDFLTFASPKALGGHNVQVVGFGVLESRPHNRVHNCVGGAYNGSQGFMLNFLSPVDPVFFLHHANIDRLWDVWTRKQDAHKNPSQYPTLPDGYLSHPNCDDPQFSPKSDYDFWSCETFLFFVDGKGIPVTAKAGDYAKIGDFNYNYQPGSGEEVVLPAAAVAAAPAITQIERFTAQIAVPSLSATQSAGGTVTIPSDLLRKATEPGGPKLFAKVAVGFPPIGHFPLTVLINAPAGSMDTSPTNPYFGGTLDMFGTQVMHCPVTFTVPLSMPLTALRDSKQLDVNRPLDIRVVPSAMPHAALLARAAEAKAEVLSIDVEAQ